MKDDSKRTSAAQLSNSFSTGGGGNNFERSVQASFLLALLIDGFSPVLECSVRKLDFQVKRLGFNTDDLLVTAGEGTESRKLLCQIKRDIRITQGDSMFQRVIQDAWHDFNRDDFNMDRDRIALATGFIAKESIDALRQLNEQATAATDEEDFYKRIEQSRFIAQNVRDKFEVIRNCLEQANGGKMPDRCTIWLFCRAYVLLVYDLDYGKSINRILLESLIRANSKFDAISAWSELCQYAGVCNQNGASVTIETIEIDAGHLLDIFGAGRMHYESKGLAHIVPDEFLAQLSLIGGWNEQNECDQKMIEIITEKPYSSVEERARKLLLEEKPVLKLENGIWKLTQRRRVFELCKDCLFDSTVKNAYLVLRKILMQPNCRLDPKEARASIITTDQEYGSSRNLRTGLVHGIALLSNREEPKHCTLGLIHNESWKLMRALLDDCDWLRLASLSDILPSLAEIHPEAYLQILEKRMYKAPDVFSQLFPKETHFYNTNYICAVLWSLEALAWDERYLIRAVRCLGVLARIPHEETNSGNTPIRSLTDILLPWYAQTLAPIDRQISAVRTLCKGADDVGWKVLISLLPHATRSTFGTNKPRFIFVNEPQASETEDSTLRVLYDAYSKFAFEQANGNSDRLSELARHVEYLGWASIGTLCETISRYEKGWSSAEKLNVRNSLFSLRDRLFLRNERQEPQAKEYQLLTETIQSMEPDDPLEKYQMLYKSRYYEGKAIDRKSYQRRENEKIAAIRNIYEQYGLEAVISFGQKVSNMADVSYKLGLSAKREAASEQVQLFVERELPKDFLENYINGYVWAHGLTPICEWLKGKDATFVAHVLSCVRLSDELLKAVNELLAGNEELFWAQVSCWNFYTEDLQLVQIIAKEFIKHGRAASAVHVLGLIPSELNRCDEALLYNALENAAFTPEKNTRLDLYSAQNIIDALQKSKNKDIERLSNLEFLYIPFSEQDSEVQPRAFSYRIANDPGFFCELMELVYLRNEETNIPEFLRRQLVHLALRFYIVPGTDWDGNFHAEVFHKWLKHVQQWGKTHELLEKILHTVGKGLSHAVVDEHGLPDTAILEELDRQENERMRQGFPMETSNQRNMHWIDPSGEAEKKLADQYEQRALRAEEMGLSRVADMYHGISKDYLAEMKYTIQTVERYKEEEEET